MDIQPLTRLLARAIAGQAHRQAQNNSDPGSEPTEAAMHPETPCQETQDAVRLYPTRS